MKQEFITIKAVAEKTGATSKAIHRRIQKGHIPADLVRKHAGRLHVDYVGYQRLISKGLY